MHLSKFIFYSLFLVLVACGGGGGSVTDNADSDTQVPPPIEENIEHLSAGDASVKLFNANAFSEPSNNLTNVNKIIQFNLGNDFFENPWVAGNASTSSRDGLGGLFNNNACQYCHIRDGRGHAPNVSDIDDGTDFSSLLIRAVKTDLAEDQQRLMAQSELANVPDSHVGGQLQHDAVIGVMPEAALRVSYQPVVMTFEDGSEVELRKPTWHLTNRYASEGYDFNTDTLFSARVAPQMIGLGLLALIPELAIFNRADPDDINNDGISGIANYVWSKDEKQVQLGRFGWKAEQPSLLEQAAGAFVNDMGLTNRLHKHENCMPHQRDCIDAINGNGDSVAEYDYEVSDSILEAITFYSAHLAVPERRNAYSNNVQAGKALFIQAGCANCHTPEYKTESSDTFPELSEQTIFPYTDLLLHDMGEDLADFTLDNEPAENDIKVAFLAGAREWRTPPLWGIGLAKTVDPNATFLHDGRARNITEAILWHGGEAEPAKQQFLGFTATKREQLLLFLNDL